MIFLLLGGLGMFLYGMKMMSDGLEMVAGDRMRHTLEILTTNRFAGVGVGAAVTSVIQSSSATTVMVVGFVNAGLMTLAQATGVIMGANIGTTITAQLIAFKLSDIAPLILFVGMFMTIFMKKRLLSRIGYIILGFGILFVGLSLMADAMKPLQDNEAFRNFLINFKNPIVGVLVGALFTAIIQSSSASVGILQALAMLGLVGLDSAVYVILGQNIGTCITAILASIGTSTNSKRAAGIHLMFNIIGTVVYLILLTAFPVLIEWIRALSGANVSRQIANFHTIFNITITVLLFPFVNQMIGLIKKILPEKVDPNKVEKKLLYLNEKTANLPAITLTQSIKELLHMGHVAHAELKLAVEAFFEADDKKAAKALELKKTVDYFNHEITLYLIEFTGMDLPEHDLKIMGGLFHVVSDMERINGHAENIAEYAQTMADIRIKMSPEGMVELKLLAEKTIDALEFCLKIFGSRDIKLLPAAEANEHEIDVMQGTYIDNHINRLQGKMCDPKAGVIFTDMITDLERTADHALNIANSIKEEAHIFAPLTPDNPLVSE